MTRVGENPDTEMKKPNTENPKRYPCQFLSLTARARFPCKPTRRGGYKFCSTGLTAEQARQAQLSELRAVSSRGEVRNRRSRTHGAFRALGSITASPAAPGRGGGGSRCFPGRREAPRCPGPYRPCAAPHRGRGRGRSGSGSSPCPAGRARPPAPPAAPARIPPTFPGDGREGGRGRGMAVPQGTAGGGGWGPPGDRRGPRAGRGAAAAASPRRRGGGLPGPGPARWGERGEGWESNS